MSFFGDSDKQMFVTSLFARSEPVSFLPVQHIKG